MKTKKTFLLYVITTLWLCGCLATEDTSYSQADLLKILTLLVENREPKIEISVSGSHAIASNESSTSNTIPTKISIPTSPATDIPNLERYNIKNFSHGLLKKANPYCTGKNALILCASGAVLVYGYIVTRLLLYAKSLSDPHAWTQWRNDIPLNVLYKLPRQEVAEELVNAIQEQYKLKITNPHQAMTLFVYDVENELQKIKTFLNMRKKIDLLKVGFLFPPQSLKIAEARESIERLEHLKTLIWHPIQ
jgi:hypothetical protein